MLNLYLWQWGQAVSLTPIFIIEPDFFHICRYVHKIDTILKYFIDKGLVRYQ